jgi:hypothetical protein
MPSPGGRFSPSLHLSGETDNSAAIEASDWGSAHRALPPVRVARGALLSLPTPLAPSPGVRPNASSHRRVGGRTERGA